MSNNAYLYLAIGMDWMIVEYVKWIWVPDYPTGSLHFRMICTIGNYETKKAWNADRLAGNTDSEATATS